MHVVYIPIITKALPKPPAAGWCLRCRVEADPVAPPPVPARIFRLDCSGDLVVERGAAIAEFMLFPEAFAKETLLSNRWFLGQSAPQSDGIWHMVLTMSEAKQEMFLERIMMLHRIALKKRSGKATPVRLTLRQWEQEASIMAALGHVFFEMCNNPSTFNPEQLASARVKIMEGLPRKHWFRGAHVTTVD